jgi:hypothetical protein
MTFPTFSKGFAIAIGMLFSIGVAIIKQAKVLITFYFIFKVFLIYLPIRYLQLLVAAATPLFPPGIDHDSQIQIL